MIETLENLPDEKIIAVECDDERLDMITRKVLSIANQSIGLHGQFNLVLSGNDALERVYAMLMLDPDLRGLPWDMTHVWKLHERVQDETIYDTITFHSGMPEEQIHTESLSQAVEADDSLQFDCCIIDLSDYEEIPESMTSKCNTIIVVADDRESLAEANLISIDGEVIWFTKTIDLLEENQ